MRTTTQLNTGLTAAAFLLIGTLAVAQTAPNARGVRPREASSGQASGQMAPYDASRRPRTHSNSSNNYKVKFPDADAAGKDPAYATSSNGRKSGSIIMHDREAQTGQASGRKDGAIQSADFPSSSQDKTLGSAHATESRGPANGARQGENPLYQGNGGAGTNPIYRPAGQAGATSHSAATGRVDYRESDDTITHAQANSKEAVQQGEGIGPDVYQRKHISGVKYEDINVSGKSSSSAQGSSTAGSSGVNTRYRPGNIQNGSGNSSMNAPGMAVNAQGSNSGVRTSKKHHR